MIPVGTLCLVVSAPLRPDLLGRQCVMNGEAGVPQEARTSYGVDYRVDFSDGNFAYGTWAGRNVIPLLEPPIEIVDVNRMVPA